MTEEKRKCKLHGCQQEFVPPLAAPHKLFCCEGHRNQFHGFQLREARKFLQAQKAAGQPKMATER
jgi:hypothetical protein